MGNVVPTFAHITVNSLGLVVKLACELFFVEIAFYALENAKKENAKKTKK